MLSWSAHVETWPLKKPFRITGYEFLEKRALVVELSDGHFVGRGEALGVYYLDENADVMLATACAYLRTLDTTLTFDHLNSTMGPGGVRNAIDCALWDLVCKQQGKRAWEIAGVEPLPRQTVFTLGIGSPEEMARWATEAAHLPALKIKLDAVDIVARLQAIRAARPDATIVVDANQGWSMDLLERVLDDLAALDVTMVEQPLARGADHALAELRPPIPICADESCLTLDELEKAAGRYQMINIKLDKTGGLTAALDLAKAAKALGLGVMVGNMSGTSLSMAPAFVLAQHCDLCDLDGPLLLTRDRLPGMSFELGEVQAPPAELWG